MSDDITPQLILKMRSPYGGWTRASLAKLGVAWPPRKGWRKELETLWREGRPRKLVHSPDLFQQPDLFAQDKDRAA